MASLAQNVAIPVQQADIIAHATVALDGRENAMQWLQTPHSALNDRTPLDVIFLARPGELERLDELLSALEYGHFV